MTKFSADEGNAAEAHFQCVLVGPPGDRDGGSQFFELHMIAEAHGVVGIRLLHPLQQAAGVLTIPEQRRVIQ